MEKNAAIIIQRWWRGSCMRLKVLEIILAGMIISRKWIQSLRFSQLRAQMRLTQYPMVISLHEIIHLPRNLLEIGSLHVVISIWWSKDEILTINSFYRNPEPPNLWKASSYYPCTINPERNIENEHLFPKRFQKRSNPKMIPILSLKERIFKLLPSNLSKPMLFAELVRLPCLSSVIRHFLSSNRAFSCAKQDTPPVHEPHPILKYDMIGRDCLNSIGRNLLSPRTRPSTLCSQKGKPKKGSDGNIKVSNPGAVVPSLLAPIRVRGYSSSTGTSSVVDEQGWESENVDLSVDFQNEDIYLPCCPGGARMKFDLYDGSCRVGSAEYFLAKDPSLIVKEEQNVTLDLWMTRGLRVVAPRFRSKPLLKFVIRRLPLHNSRCGVAMINILGTGPIRRNLKFRRLVESFFHISSEVFLSLDGKALHIYEDYSFPAPMFSIPLLSVATLVVGYCDRPVERSEDRMMIILNTFEKDIIQIHFAESRVREIWIRTLMQALHSPSLSFIH